MTAAHPSPRPARLSDPETSWAAGTDNRIPRSRLRRRVLDLHRQHPDGLTDDEVIRLVAFAHPGSIAKRRWDLVHAGQLIDSGRRRRTRWGSWATVWQLSEPPARWRPTPEGRYRVCGCEEPATGAGAMCRRCRLPNLAALLLTGGAA